MGLSRYSPNRHGGGSVVIFVEKGGDKYAVQNWRETRQGCLQVRILRYVSPIRRQHRHASTLPKVHRGNLYEDFLATLGSDASCRGLIKFCIHPQRHDHNRQMKHRRYTQGTHRLLQELDTYRTEHMALSHHTYLWYPSKPSRFSYIRLHDLGNMMLPSYAAPYCCRFRVYSAFKVHAFVDFSDGTISARVFDNRMQRNGIEVFMSNIKIEFDEDALRKVAQDAFEEKVFSGDIDYDCPECGKPIKITGTTNTCECGFVLTGELDEVRL